MQRPSADVTRQALGLAGLIFAVAAVVTGHPFLIWLAIAFLAGSLAIRAVLHIRRRRSE